MAQRLIGGNLRFAPVALRNWRATGALSQAGSRQAAMRAPALMGNGGNLRITGFCGNQDELAQNWRRTGANWRSKGASAPVVYPPVYDWGDITTTGAAPQSVCRLAQA